MKVAFFHSEKPRERLLAEAFAEGIRIHGDQAELVELPGNVDCDVACMVGVKSRELFRGKIKQGAAVIYFDKGYLRHRAPGREVWEYWRVSVNAHHPTAFLASEKCQPDRLDALSVDRRPWREAGDHIVFAGSSAKYHAFYGLPDPTKYAAKIIRRLAKRTGRQVVYRPKPSWRDAVEIVNSRFSGSAESIGDVLRGAHALVTHGSNACFEAVLAGVPCVILGDAVAKPISSTSIDEASEPRLASDDEVMQWLANLAYCQWTMSEFRDGLAWPTIRRQVLS